MERLLCKHAFLLCILYALKYVEFSYLKLQGNNILQFRLYQEKSIIFPLITKQYNLNCSIYYLLEIYFIFANMEVRILTHNNYVSYVDMNNCWIILKIVIKIKCRLLGFSPSQCCKCCICVSDWMIDEQMDKNEKWDSCFILWYCPRLKMKPEFILVDSWIEDTKEYQKHKLLWEVEKCPKNKTMIRYFNNITPKKIYECFYAASREIPFEEDSYYICIGLQCNLPCIVLKCMEKQSLFL